MTRDPSSYRSQSTEMFGSNTGFVTHERDQGPGDSWSEGTDVEEEVVAHPLDEPEVVEQHARLMGHYSRELERQSLNRLQMAEDEAFYDHDQWTAEERAILEDRGQMPLVYNVTQTAVNWVLGSQRRQPLDYAVLPRRKQGSAHAERKTEILKYLADVNDSAVHTAEAFAEQVKAGLGWLECGVTDDDGNEPLYERHESWRFILHDSASREPDFSDGRYIFRIRWTDTDRAMKMFPERKYLVESSAETVFGGATASRTGSGDGPMDEMEAASQTFGSMLGGYGNWSASRDRVRLIEAWYRTPMEVDVVSGGDFTGEIYDPRSDGHLDDIESGRATLRRRIRERVMVAIMCDSGMLWHGESPYRHNMFPFTPVWGYRRASDGLPYGLIRGVRDIQRDVNKRASKNLFHLSAQKTMVQKGAVDDIEILREESQRPDAIIEYNAGYPPPSTMPEVQLASAHAELMSRGINMIQQISGVTDEQMGRESNATSGKAILARQEQGALTTSRYYENLAFARKTHGMKILVNIEQFMDSERQFRITGKSGGKEFIAINDDNPDDDNQITRTKADFVVTERDYRATERQASMQLLMENLARMAPAMPGLAPAILDLVVDASDIPNRDEIVKRIRAITGQTDPEAEEDQNDPEVMAKKEAAAIEAQMMMRARDAEIGGIEAQAAERQAKALKAAADAALSNVKARETESQAELHELSKFEVAVRAATALAAMGGVGEAADMIMRAAELRASALSPQGKAPVGLPAPAPEIQPQEAAYLPAQDAPQQPMQTVMS